MREVNKDLEIKSGTRKIRICSNSLIISQRIVNFT